MLLIKHNRLKVSSPFPRLDQWYFTSPRRRRNKKKLQRSGQAQFPGASSPGSFPPDHVALRACAFESKVSLLAGYTNFRFHHCLPECIAFFRVHCITFFHRALRHEQLEVVTPWRQASLIFLTIARGLEGRNGHTKVHKIIFHYRTG